MTSGPPSPALLEAIVEAPYQLEGWSAVIQRLQTHIASSSTSIVIRDVLPPHTFRHRSGTPVDRSIVEAYEAHWHAHDPLRAFAGKQAGAIAIGSRFVPPSELEALPFYNEWAVPAGLAHALTSKLCEIDGRVFMIAFNRDKTAPDFDDTDAAKLKVLVPYLRNALIVESYIERHDERTTMISDMLETFEEAAVIIDRNGHVIVVNRLARQLLEADLGLQLDMDLLAANTPADTQRLRQWLVAPLSVGGSSCLLLAAPATRSPLRLMKMRLPGSSSSSGAQLLFVRPLTHRTNVLPEEELREVLFLSPTEAGIVHRLACGESLESIALHMQIAVGTVRNHLKRIFNKLGVTRQVELVALVLSLMPTVMPHSRGSVSGGSSR